MTNEKKTTNSSLVGLGLGLGFGLALGIFEAGRRTQAEPTSKPSRKARPKIYGSATAAVKAYLMEVDVGTARGFEAWVKKTNTRTARNAALVSTTFSATVSSLRAVGKVHQVKARHWKLGPEPRVAPVVPMAKFGS